MDVNRSLKERRVLIVAPTQRDGAATLGLLAPAGIHCDICPSLEELCDEIRVGCCAVILPEELLPKQEDAELVRLMGQQPVWSDLPVIILARPGGESESIERATRTLGNVSVVERPMRISTFLSMVRVAQQARERQYQVREHILEQRENERRLAESEQRSRAAFEQSVVGIVFSDLDGKVQRVNDAFCKMVGYSSGQLIGKTSAWYTHADDMRVADGIVSQMKRDGASSAVYEKRFTCADGRTIFAHVSLSVIRNSQLTPETMVAVVEDVTHRRETEIELQEAKEAAEAANRAKDEFLAVLSHELRTPLTPVLLIASSMENNKNLPDEFKDDVATIRQNVELESRLISDLLDVTRIVKGKLQLDIQEVDLHQLIRSAIAICQREASAKLTVELNASSFTVKGDCIRLQQTFWNLINNAMKFTPGDGMITVRSENAREGWIRLEVSDTGAGIDPELLPRLFNAFEQGEVTTQRQRAGLGLGLSISRSLSQLHGGSIWAESEGRGKGSKFVVELPTIVQTVQTVESAPSTDSLRRKRALKVLLVEDHDATQKVLARLLRMSGHLVTVVGSVASAQAAVEMDGFDIIVSDLGLPDGSGLDIMRPLRDRYAGRAIALTGFGMDADIQACRDAGFTEHITKPVDVNVLELTIGRMTAALG